MKNDTSSTSNLPRVLIVSVNPLSSDSNNGKTYASFFDGYPQERIAQLYFHRELPSSEVSKNYYRISDEEAISSLVRKGSRGGRVKSSTTQARLFSPSVTRQLAASGFVRSIRTAILSVAHRKIDSQLRIWLEEFRPELIFFSGGDAKYLYPLVGQISALCQAPIASYITDDYILPRKTDGIFAKLLRYNLRKCFVNFHRQDVASIYTIGSKMRDVYDEEYGLSSSTLMNLAPYNPLPLRVLPEVKILTYAGGLHLNRWRTLLQVGEACSRLSDLGIQARLDIYTSTTLDSEMRQALSQHDSIRLMAPVSSSRLRKIYDRSDVLIHVESFSETDIAATRLSVSTKIPEYLGSGRPILAIGPPDIASIEHLRLANAAFVSSSSDIESVGRILSIALNNEEQRRVTLKAARILSQECHDSATIRRQLWRELSILTEERRKQDKAK